ncbi:MAG: thioredoxin domain-containing protein [Alphaproteobacteria bacterium]|nr:thioredoxin domain-containing protein [Alphaproteobacteria bacterium]
MTWTILVLILAIALFLFGGMLVKVDAKKPTMGSVICKKSIKLVAILLIAGCVSRFYTPYYLTHVNPGIVREMINAMQAQESAEKNKAVRAYVRSNANKMIADAPVLGNRDAKKTVFVWTDFSCPYCRRVHGELARVLAERDDVRVVIKNFSIHGDLSDGPAKAAIAAKMQDADKAAKFVDMMMTREFYSQDDLKDQSKVASKVEANIMKMAKEAGLDTDKLKKDMNNEIVSSELANVRDLAQRFEINGTPFLVIGEEAFPGAIPYDQIINALDK